MDIETPRFEQSKPTVIGRFVRIRLVEGMGIYDGTVMDAVAGENLPKRVRIQSKGPRQGCVAMPGQYDIMEFL